MIYDVFTINLQNVSCWFAWTKKSRFSAFFPHRAIVQKFCFPVGTTEGFDGESFPSGFLRVFFGFSSGWHSFPILVVERVAARINQVVECLAAVMVAKTVVDGFVSDKSVFVCRHDGICLKGFVLLWVFVSQKYTTICAIYLRRWRKMHFFHHFRSFFSRLRRKTAYLMSNFASGNSKQAFFGIKIIKVSAVIACYFVVRVA